MQTNMSHMIFATPEDGYAIFEIDNQARPGKKICSKIASFEEATKILDDMMEKENL